MRKTAILMLVLACVLGAGAVYMARDWLQQQMHSANQVEKKTVDLTTVVVAKRPLKFGDKLGSDVIEEVSWPVANAPKGGFKTIAEVVGTGERRVVLHSIQSNEPILKSKISGFGGRATLSTVIDEGLRAVTIRVNDVNGVAGFVLPGDRVDILLTRTPVGAKGGNSRITDVLMQNIKVLGIDQDSNKEKDKPKVVRAVTVEVTTDHSQKLALAQQVGTLSLTLRNATNTKPITHRRIRVRDLIDDLAISDTPDLKAAISAVKSSKPRKRKRFARRRVNTSVKVFRGVKSTVHTVVPEAANRKRRTNKSGTPEPQPKPSGSLEKSVTPEQVERDRPASAGPTSLQPGSASKISAPVAPVAVKRSKTSNTSRTNEPTAWFGTPISPVPPIQSVTREKLSFGSQRPAKGTNVRYRD